MAVIGSEVIQFGRALPLGGGRFRLSHLLRGRGGSEWAAGQHVANEPFCLLKPGTVQPVVLPNWSIGATLSARVPGGTPTSIEFLGESVRPLSPINLRGKLDVNGNATLSWTRRSRQGVAWRDGVDTPLGEAREQYRVNVSGSSGAIEMLCSQPLLTIGAADLAALGNGPLSIEVCQIGDVAASRAAQLTLQSS